MADCWETALKAELSQGDLLSDLLIGTAAYPKVALKPGPTKAKGAANWDASPWKAVGTDMGMFLARGWERKAVVVTEDCEIEKDGASAAVAVAPVFPLSSIQNEARRQDALDRKRFPFVPLTAIDGLLESSYADLRYITYINRHLIDEAQRLRSMNEQGVFDLRMQIVAYFTHIPFGQIIKAP